MSKSAPSFRPACESARPVRIALAAYAAVLIFCFVASTAAAVAWAQAGYAAWPHASWLYWPEYRFSDFTEYAEQCRYIGHGFFQHQGASGPFAYNAPAAFLFAAFVRPFGADIVAALGFYLAFFLLCFLMFMAVLAASSRRSPVRVAAWRSLLLSAVLSYPVWFLADRGNIEGALWVLIAAGVFFWCRGRDLPAALCLGVAVACKFVYAPLLLLFVPRRKWPPLLLPPVFLVVLTLLALHALGPSVGEAWRNISGALGNFGNCYFLELREWELGFNHSLLGLIKRGLFLALGPSPF